MFCNISGKLPKKVITLRIVGRGEEGIEGDIFPIFFSLFGCEPFELYCLLNNYLKNNSKTNDNNKTKIKTTF